MQKQNKKCHGISLLLLLLLQDCKASVGKQVMAYWYYIE